MDNRSLKYLIIGIVSFVILHVGLLYSQQSTPLTDSLRQLISISSSPDQKSEILIQLGQAWVSNNNPDSALACYQAAYSLLDDTLGSQAGTIWNETGLVYYRQGDFASALSYFKISLYIAQTQNDSTMTARRFSNIGVIYDYLGDYVKSIENYQQALKIFEAQQSKRGMAFIFNNMGVISLEMGNAKNALKYHHQALELKSSLNDRKGMGSSLNNIGVVYEQLLAQYDSSKYYYQKALDVFNSIDNKRGIATSLGNIGIIYWLKKLPDSAIYYSSKALAIRESLDDDEGISSTLLNLGRENLDNGNLNSAENYFRRSLQISKRINSRKRISDIYEALALLYNKKADFKKAYTYHVKYSALKDSILNEENTKQIAELKTRYEVEKKDKQLKALSQQNQLQQKSILRYNFLLISIGLIVLLITFITILLFRQNRFKIRQQTSELRQKLLRSQMNPHFIFNTLFSIQTYMLENDALSASRFLSQFAKLMRHILENSKHEFVSLEDELEFLNNYLHIQQLRFNESFVYNVKFIQEKNEEASQILIPPMLSQPFVENAIDHGIRNINRTGKIEVTFEISGKSLRVKIKDNGVGFNHKTRQKDKSAKHQSTGIDNARQRIRLLNHANRTPYNFTIIDLNEEDISRTGTLIIFAIPLIYA